ncbi:MAG: immunity 17 family protein [Bacteroidales bacterium]
MDIKPYFSAFIFALPGAIALMAALLNWEWFYKTRTASFFVDQLGRIGARIFYSILGALLIVASIVITIESLI